jgi:hypothetical protein
MPSWCVQTQRYFLIYELPRHLTKGILWIQWTDSLLSRVCSWTTEGGKLRKLTVILTLSWTDFKESSRFFYGATAPSEPRPSHYRGHTITHWHTTLGKIPLDEWSSRRREIYLTYNILERQSPMSLAGFEHTIPASEPPQTRALDRTATGIGR